MTENTPDAPSGWTTMLDGTRVPLTSQEAAEIWKTVETVRRSRAEAMPDTYAALSAISAATQRLRELGWDQMGPRTGVPTACVEMTSTGMWEATRDGEFIHYAGCVSSPRNRSMFFKPISDLTPDEQVTFDKCTADLKRSIWR